MAEMVEGSLGKWELNIGRPNDRFFASFSDRVDGFI